MDDIEEYYKSNFDVTVGFDSTSIVNAPTSLTPSNHINRESIISKYKDRHYLNHVISYMTDKKYLKDREKLRVEMIRYLDRLSTNRGDWKKLWGTI